MPLKLSTIRASTSTSSSISPSAVALVAALKPSISIIIKSLEISLSSYNLKGYLLVA